MRELLDLVGAMRSLAGMRMQEANARSPASLCECVRGWHPPVSAGHVKKPDLLRMRPVEHLDRLGGGLQYYLAALLREISLSLRR
jgi:hypothetical protein